MIAATLNNAAAVADRLAALAPQADAALAGAADDLTERLRSLVDRKLSGEVLNARTGALRASLRAGVEQASGIVGSVSAAAPYARFQEYGFAGTESVRASTRRISRAFGRAIAPVTAPVRAHDRRVDYPAHSYLRSALAELAPDIGSALRAAMAEALES
jgi:murein DD-endopeptidase MepM/ murein hydrolase activator NlpD